MSQQFQQFLSLLDDLELKDSVVPLLSDNGFDDWDTIKELTVQILQDIGIQEENIAKQILACVNSVDVEFPSENLEQLKIGQENSQESNGTLEREETINILDPKPISEALVTRGTTLKKDKNESQEKFFCRIMSLALDGKNISHIASLEKCRKLKNLYLHNNRIVKMENLSPLRTLIHLHLENNRIRKIEGLEGLQNLKKLYLNKNEIKMVEGLEDCEMLEELHVSEQNTKEPLLFDPRSMVMIANSLRVLEAEGNNISDTSAISYLNNLSLLNLRRNNIESVESMEQCFACLIQLVSLDVRENPVEKVPKIRDQVFMMSSNLRSFNGKEILPAEREFLYKFYNIKNSRGKTAPSGDQKSKTKKGDELVISGNPLLSEDSNAHPYLIKKSLSLNGPNQFNQSHITVHTMTKKMPMGGQTKSKPF